jgi:hypothetical protein
VSIGDLDKNILVESQGQKPAMNYLMEKEELRKC